MRFFGVALHGRRRRGLVVYFLKCFQTVWLMHMHLLVAACLVMFTVWKFEDFSFTHCNLLGRLQKYTKAFEMAKMAVFAIINSPKNEEE